MNFLEHVSMRSKHTPDILRTNDQKFFQENPDHHYRNFLKIENLKKERRQPLLQLEDSNCMADKSLIYNKALAGHFPLDADSSAVDFLISDGNRKHDLRNESLRYKKLLIEREIFYTNSLKEKKQRYEDIQSKMKLRDGSVFEGDILHSLTLTREEFENIQVIFENKIKSLLKKKEMDEKYYNEWKEETLPNITEIKQHVSNTRDAYDKLMMKFEQVKKETEEQMEDLEELNDVYSSITNSIQNLTETYNILKSRAEEQLEKANMEFEKMNGDTLPLQVLELDVKRKIYKVSCLENELNIKIKENESLQNLKEEILYGSK